MTDDDEIQTDPDDEALVLEQYEREFGDIDLELGQLDALGPDALPEVT